MKHAILPQVAILFGSLADAQRAAYELAAETKAEAGATFSGMEFVGPDGDIAKVRAVGARFAVDLHDADGELMLSV